MTLRLVQGHPTIPPCPAGHQLHLGVAAEAAEIPGLRGERAAGSRMQQRERHKLASPRQASVLSSLKWSYP